jgi:lambda family phage minor tail protein L
MLNTTPTFAQELNKPTNQPIFLYTLFAYDGSSDLNLAGDKTNVTFDGVEYTAFPISHDVVSENSQGEINAVKLVVSNISRLIQGYLETYDLRDKKVRIRLVWRNRLAYPLDKIDFEYYIDSWSSDKDSVVFLLLPRISALGLKIPARIYSRNYCQWKNFKGTECGYAGAETTCNRTKQRCKELGNYKRFGGFPSIPTKQLQVV